MSILIRRLFKKIVSISSLNQVVTSNQSRTLSSSLFPSTSSSSSTMSSRHNDGSSSGPTSTTNCLKESGTSLTTHSFHSQERDRAVVEEKYDYESAVLKLHSLVSNAEVLASIRATTREYRHLTHIQNIHKFILRSGITEEELDGMSMIHVSGTKGKGSTCAFCERVLHSKGYKTGLFTSPHLVEVRERIRINGRPVSKEVYAHHFWKVYNRLMATQEDKDEKLPAYFAFNMILSLHVFLAEGVDVCVMEVGIGGQYDSTNFIRRPVVCGVTSLGYDHVSLLGNTIEQIAWNKAGIFKTGSPAVVVNQPPSAMEVILDRAKERKSALYLSTPIDKDVLARENVNLGISGQKQAVNAGLAVQLARMWEERHRASQEPLPCNVSDVSSAKDIPVLGITRLDDVTAKGLSSCVWPGRAQTIKRPGMPVTYYLDGAHTMESVEVCSQWFKETADEEMKSLKGKVVRVLLFNVTGERKPGPLLECLKGCGFDAAGFCTNTVSSVDYFNKKDQINPMYTSKVMMEKTEGNRQCWDQLHSYHNNNNSDSQLEHHGTRSVGNNHDISDGNATITTPDAESVVKKRVVEKSSFSSNYGSASSSSSNSSSSSTTSSSTASSSSTSSSSKHATNAMSGKYSSNTAADKHSSRDYIVSKAGTSTTANLNNKESKNNNDDNYDGLDHDFDNIENINNNDNNNVKKNRHHHHHRPQHSIDAVVIKENSSDNIQDLKKADIPAMSYKGDYSYCQNSLVGDVIIVENEEKTTLNANNSRTSAQQNGFQNEKFSSPSSSSSSSLSSSSSPSESFPCVLQALVWATQAKDRSLVTRDGSPIITANLPPIPPALVDADHVQVLVTGSLLLVGGVLGVVDPLMNEEC